MKQYFAWFYNLTEREQKIVSIGGIAFVVALFYFLIWSPLKQDLAKQELALAADKSLLVWVNEQANKASQLKRSSSSKSFAGSLTQLVNSSARSNGISVSRMQPQGENLQISVDRVNFESLISWMDYLEQQGVVVLFSDITETDASGFVQVRRLQIGKS
jgi:general secretion pathway protein M